MLRRGWMVYSRLAMQPGSHFTTVRLMWSYPLDCWSISRNPSPVVREMMRVLRVGGVFYSDIVPRKFSLFRSLDWVRQLKRMLMARMELHDAFYERSFTRQETLIFPFDALVQY